MLTFGEELKRLRTQAGIIQQDLADAVGLDITYISKIENNRIDPPSEAAILKMADLLKADADELLRLAGRVSTEVQQYLVKHPEVLKQIRRLMKEVDPA